MSDKRRERKLRDARKAADRLAALGHPFEAEAVNALCRSHVQLAETAKRLWRDNQTLRDRLEAGGLTDG